MWYYILLYAVAIISTVVLSYLVLTRKRFIEIPPGKVMVVFNVRTVEDINTEIITSGGRHVSPIFESYHFLDVKEKEMTVQFEDIVSKEGVMFEMIAIVTSKIHEDIESLNIATVMLLEKSHEDIEYLAMKTIEGHTRGTCASLTIDQLSVENEVSCIIMEMVRPDLKDMGLDIVSMKILSMKYRS